jgi:tail assembly chaperone E/41/14-like protein
MKLKLCDVGSLLRRGPQPRDALAALRRRLTDFPIAEQEYIPVDQATEMTLELMTPLQPLGGQGEVIRVLQLREPTAGELAKASVGSGIESNILLIAEITKQPPGLIRNMGARDYGKATAFLLGFLNPDRETGASSALT